MIGTRQLYHGLNPVKQLAAKRCDLMINLSASPWHNEKGGVRQTLVTDAAFELD
jgi:NAD+ synthase (glutamine-hydrolysing)